MAGIAPENFEEEFEINKIRQNIKLTPMLRQSMIEETRKSFYNKKKNSSFKTVINISNNMIGTSVLIFPLIFMKYGIINGTLILILMAAISCEMCLLENRHVKMDEMDLPESIRRILGVKWFYSFVISSFVFNAFSVIIYYCLMSHLLYSILQFFFYDGWEEPLIASISEFTFSKFSVQYLEIILAVIMLLLYSINNLKYLLVFCQYGILGIFFYVIFLFYKAIENFISGNIVSQNLRYVSQDVSTVVGVFSLAFFCHNNLITIVKTNRHPEKNSRDIILSFVLTGGVYLFIGVLGVFATAGLQKDAPAQLVLDYFNDSLWTILIEFFILLQMISVSPLNWYIGRTQMLELIYEDNPTPKFVFVLVNFSFVVLCFLVDLLKIDLALMIAMNGAFCGYIMLYIIPIKLHLNCLYEIHYENEKDIVYDGKLLMNNFDLGYLNIESPASVARHKIEDQKERALIENLKMSKLGGLEIEKKTCKSAHLTMIRRTPKASRYLLYGLIALFGGVIAIWEIIDIAKGNY